METKCLVCGEPAKVSFSADYISTICPKGDEHLGIYMVFRNEGYSMECLEELYRNLEDTYVTLKAQVINGPITDGPFIAEEFGVNFYEKAIQMADLNHLLLDCEYKTCEDKVVIPYSHNRVITTYNCRVLRASLCTGIARLYGEEAFAQEIAKLSHIRKGLIWFLDKYGYEGFYNIEEDSQTQYVNGPESFIECATAWSYMQGE